MSLDDANPGSVIADILPSGRALWNGHDVPCVIGRGGVRRVKQEGDGATPAGLFPLRRVLWRPDRLSCPITALPCQPIAPDDGWCDDPADPAYNRPVRRPYPASHESMWRDDALYDIVVVIGHNDDPPGAGQGSAVFLHIARADGSPTEGCVAFALADLLTLLRDCGPGSAVRIAPPPSIQPPDTPLGQG